MSPEDSARLEQIRSRLYNFVANAGEESADVKRARAMLGRIPKGPARGPSLGSQPAVAPDSVSASDVQPDYGKRNLNMTIQGRNDRITTPEAHAASDTRHRAEDPIANDPLAGMIVQSIPAAGAGALAGGIVGHVAPTFSKLASGAAGGAVANPDDPLTGAAIGAVPGIPSAVHGADMAIGRLAVDAPSLVNVGKAAGAAAGTHLGYKAGGFVGAGVGASIGSKVGGVAGRLADRAVGALGDRYLTRTAKFPKPNIYTPPEFPSAASESAGPIIDAEVVHTPPATMPPKLLGAAPSVRLSPLTPEPGAPPRYTPGTFGEPIVDDFGVPITQAGPIRGHATVGKGTAIIPKGEDIGFSKTQIAKDVQRIASEPPETQPGPAGPSLEDQLAKSVAILDKLKRAKASGTLTLQMEQEAIDAGLSKDNVARAIGRPSGANADNPIVRARKDQIRRDAKNARILSGRSE